MLGHSIGSGSSGVYNLIGQGREEARCVDGVGTRSRRGSRKRGGRKGGGMVPDQNEIASAQAHWGHNVQTTIIADMCAQFGIGDWGRSSEARPADEQR